MNIRCTPSDLHGKIDLKSNCRSILFLLCTGALSKEGVTLKNIDIDGLTGKILNLMDCMGANVSVRENSVAVSKNRLFGMITDVNGSELEFFIYCALAAVCEKGFTQITGLHTVNRNTVDLTVRTLTKMRVACSFDDNDELIIWGGNDITGGTADAENNEYLSLMLTVLSCGAAVPVDIHNAGDFERKFPHFIKNFNSLSGKIELIK